MASVEKALDLIKLVEVEWGHGLGVSELARRTNLPKSTAYRLLATLELKGAVESVDGHYRPGSRFNERLAIPASEVTDRVQKIVTPYLAALFEQSRMTAHLAVPVPGQIVFLNKLHAVHDLPSPSRIGGRAPEHCTSLGKVLLAFDTDALNQVCSRELQRWTPATITDPDILRQDIAGARKSRLGRDDGEYVDQIGSVASVVLDGAGRPVASLAVTGPRERIGRRFDAILLEIGARASQAYQRAETGAD